MLTVEIYTEETLCPVWRALSHLFRVIFGFYILLVGAVLFCFQAYLDTLGQHNRATSVIGLTSNGLIVIHKFQHIGSCRFWLILYEHRNLGLVGFFLDYLVGGVESGHREHQHCNNPVVTFMLPRTLLHLN